MRKSRVLRAGYFRKRRIINKKFKTFPTELKIYNYQRCWYLAFPQLVPQLSLFHLPWSWSVFSILWSHFKGTVAWNGFWPIKLLLVRKERNDLAHSALFENVLFSNFLDPWLGQKTISRYCLFKLFSFCLSPPPTMYVQSFTLFFFPVQAVLLAWLD